MRAQPDQNERSGELFDSLPLPESPAAAAATAAAAKTVQSARVRVILPNREQVELRAMELELPLPAGHCARLVWAWVERQDLSAMYAAIKVREGGVGRSAIAPQILLALWLYATLEGVGSARQWSRLVMERDAHRWISGGVQVNHHSLSDFRVAHGAALDELPSTRVAALMSAGAVKLEAARQRVRELKEQLDADPARDSRRQAAAQQRARPELHRRVQPALERLPELEEIKRRNSAKAEARASTTDAEASVMKMADGGFQPAYNAQFASDCDAQVMVGVALSTSGSDLAQLAPLVEHVQQRVGQVPVQWRLDGGFPAHEQIDAVNAKTEVDAPVPQPRAKKDDEGNDIAQEPHQPKSDASPAVAQWRQRRAGGEAREIYKLRAATAECVNAPARNRGLQRLPVRGVVRLFALAHNLMRTFKLAPALLGLGSSASACGAGTA